MKNWQPLGLALALVVGLWLGRGCGAWESGHDLSRGRSFHEHMGGSGDQARLMNVLHRIEDLYVDTFDRTRLVDVAIEAMLDELDPHTVYFGEELASMSENMEGNSKGIGVEFLIQQDTLMVVAAIPGGPSDKAGIRAGDRIVAVEGEAISGPELDNSRVMRLLKGPRGTEVNLGIDRRGEPFQVHLTRDRIPIQSVVASFILEEEVGYVKAIRFAANTAQEFEGALFSWPPKAPRHWWWTCGATAGLLERRGGHAGLVLGRRPNHGLHRRQIVPPQELHLSPPGTLCGLACGGVGGRGLSLGQRNLRRGRAGQRPRLGRGPPHVRKRPGARGIPGAWVRRPSVDCRPFLHAHGPRHPKALRRLRGGLRRALGVRRVVPRGQHAVVDC